ncbi:unnamed protein product [Ceutorhynchus assimilis]|uniref:Uncharacterized protein n=1 Tax=Ceutorhynchus assimilis TaxID=467358 RepID=A0A9P0DH18_9CUCU|nr:unnamed protein product [Ceutorhynchus assimilis]
MAKTIHFCETEPNDNLVETARNNLLDNLSICDLEKLEKIFKSKRPGLYRDEFYQAIQSFYNKEKLENLQTNRLFEEITENKKETITWNDLLDYLIKNIYPEIRNRLSLRVSSIETVAHTKNESVAKIVLIETEQYFCYAIILKHGRVGLYDGNLNFLTSYHAIMTREDLTRPEDERRRRNRWVTDAIFCPDTLMFIITNTARSIVIYEASGLEHVAYWLILSTPNILECLSYKSFTKLDLTNYSHSVLFSGDCNGEVMSFTFLQPKNGLLRRKRNDDITLFYWRDFIKENEFVKVKNYGRIHGDSIKHIKYFDEVNLLLTCSKDQNASVVIKDGSNKKKTVFYKVTEGVSCFALSTSSKILITGSNNGLIRLWNTFLAKPIALFSEYQQEVIDIQIMESQDLFFSCSNDAIFKLWDLKEHTCLQTIKLKFPSFRIHGKLIEWGINCMYPGPRRKNPDESSKLEIKKECFGISDINEMKLEFDDKASRNANLWDRSCILVTCCNYIAKLRTNFTEASIEYGFSFPILPPPPLQNSVLIPSNWGLQSDGFDLNKFEQKHDPCTEKRLRELDFILNKDILEEIGTRSDINYKIAILESKKEKMRSKVALGSPYLALDLHEIPPLRLSEDLPKNKKYHQKIKLLLDEATHKDSVFSSPESSSSRSKSSKSSTVELPY